MRLLRSIHDYDVNTFVWCAKHKYRKHAVILSRWVSFTANGPFYVIAGMLFLYLQMWDIAKLFAVGFIVERAYYFLLKPLFRRNRPTEIIPDFVSAVQAEDKFSFPSGHTSAAFLVATAVEFAFPGSGWILYPWACSVGIARVVLGVHFPTDVLAGALLGYTLCLTLISLLF